MIFDERRVLDIFDLYLIFDLKSLSTPNTSNSFRKNDRSQRRKRIPNADVFQGTRNERKFVFEEADGTHRRFRVVEKMKERNFKVFKDGKKIPPNDEEKTDRLPS